MNYKAAIGITSGTALCGVVGHRAGRREYTVLGDIVNLSARLMQKAKGEKGGVITDEQTKLAAHDVLFFESRPEIMVKGKNESIKIHRPYPRMSTLMEFRRKASLLKNIEKVRVETNENAVTVIEPIGNVMEAMHTVQVTSAHRRLSLLNSSVPSINSSNNDTTTGEEVELCEGPMLSKIKCSLMNICLGINAVTVSGAFILEGDIGVGKSRLLRSVLQDEKIRKKCTILWTTENPFLASIAKPYCTWSDVICNARPSTMKNDEWTEFISEKLFGFREENRFLKMEEKERILKYAHCLNVYLGTTFEQVNQSTPNPIEQHTISIDHDLEKDFEDILQSYLNCFSNHVRENVEMLLRGWGSEKCRLSRRTHTVLDPYEAEANDWGRISQDIDDTPRLNMIGLLLLRIVHGLNVTSSTIYVIDNAMHMDEMSWILSTIISTFVKNCTVLISTRPPCSGRSVHTSRSLFRKQLRYVHWVLGVPFYGN